MAAAAPALSTQAANQPAAGGMRLTEVEAQSVEESRWQPFFDLACQLTVDIPLADFHVADFLQMQAGSVLVAHWRLTRDVPLRVNGILIAWGELEAAGNRLAIRLTELA
jgi:flagellar motor switch/type III secretory pathway protein FliN